MTATAWALTVLRGRRPGAGPLSSVHGRAVLLALAALADEALDTGDGYSSTTDEAVARVTGMAPSTVTSWLRTLVEVELAVRTSTHRFRVPEAAFAQ